MRYLQARSINSGDVCWILTVDSSIAMFQNNESFMDKLEEGFSQLICPNNEDYFGLEVITEEEFDFIQAFDLAPTKEVIIWFNMEDAYEKFKDGVVIRKGGKLDFRFPSY